MEDQANQSALPRGLIGRKGTPAGKTARLPSIRTPKDLTLGGKPKKSFVPNIPSRRDKKEEQECYDFENSNNGRPARGGKSRRGDRGGRGRGTRGKNTEVLQSQSIFEQGPAGRMQKRGGSFGYGAYGHVEGSDDGGGGGGKFASKSGSRTSEVGHIPMNAEDKALIDGLINDETHPEHHQKDDPNMIPIKLPLITSVNVENIREDQGKAELPDMKPEADIKDEIKDEKVNDIKDESYFDDLYGEDMLIKGRNTNDADVRPLEVQDILNNLEKSDIGNFWLLQLPDTLPGNIYENEKKEAVPVDPMSNLAAAAAPMKSPEELLSEKLRLNSLKSFSEGFIGKLQIRKSGKAQLILGNAALDVSLGTPSGFLQDVVSVDTEPSNEHMCVLGHISHKLVCTPDMESMLNG